MSQIGQACIRTRFLFLRWVNHRDLSIGEHCSGTHVRLLHSTRRPRVSFFAYYEKRGVLHALGTKRSLRIDSQSHHNCGCGIWGKSAVTSGGKSYLLADQPTELERLQLQSRVCEHAGRALMVEA